ncbi:hypothetical protein MHYP_G00217770 [Metynnis hypsauchen]
MCIDYRTLNSKTIPDQYTTPCIDDALDCLAGSRWFSVLDLRSGYYQIAMSDQDKEKTAFICPLGFYQFERMLQGVTGAPATFQRLMEKAVGDMNLLQVLVYLDDLIVFGATLEEHEERLLRVLDRLEDVGLKVSLDKCQFCQPKVRYMGHIVSAEGIAADTDKIEAVPRWPQPTDLKSLRSFLGFCGYYRRFIAGYSSIVKSLTDLTKGYPPTNKRKVENHKQADGKSKLQMYFHKLGVPSDGIPPLYAFPTQLELGQLQQLTVEDLRNAQSDDVVISEVRKFVHSGEWPADVTKLHPDVALMKRQSGKLIEKGGLVYRITQRNSDGEIHQLLLPGKFREQVIKSFHDDMGHLGVDRTLELVRNRFYWPRMSQTVEQYVKNCGSCIAWKSPCIRAAPLHQIVTSGPMELVCIDFLCLEPDSKGFSNILVVTDHFSRYSHAYPTKDQRAVTVAKTLVERLPVDVCFGAEEREGVSHHRYVENLRQDLQNAYELAAKAAVPCAVNEGLLLLPREDSQAQREGSRSCSPILASGTFISPSFVRRGRSPRA